MDWTHKTGRWTSRETQPQTIPRNTKLHVVPQPYLDRTATPQAIRNAELTYAEWQRLGQVKRNRQLKTLWTLALLAIVELFLSGCTTEPYRVFNRTAMQDRACLESYGGLQGYCDQN